METEINVKAEFGKFILNYPINEKKKIWEDHSIKFRKFWEDRILNQKGSNIDDDEIDDIIRILDRSGKGNHPGVEAVARAWIWQGAWRRMFYQLRKNKKLSQLLNEVFNAKSDTKKVQAIDTLYKANEKNKNNLTGANGNALNAMLVAFDPFSNLSMISLKDRIAFIDYFNIPFPGRIDVMTYGEKMVESANAIKNWFRNIGLDYDARTISVFCYTGPMESRWKKTKNIAADNQPVQEESETEIEEEKDQESLLFNMEKQLEDFLIQNWEKTILGEKYELLEENGELVSQQYFTDVGRIDILARDKSDGRYVVVELKLGQASDVTVGQLTRYMGWLEENKCKKGQLTKGVIIAAQYDPKIYYAIKKVADVEVFEYRVKFELVPYSNK